MKEASERLRLRAAESKQWLQARFAEARRQIDASEEWCHTTIEDTDGLYGDQAEVRTQFQAAVQKARDDLAKTEKRLFSELQAVLDQLLNTRRK